VPRRVIGLIFLVLGLPLLVVAATGWTALAHAEGGTFGADLAPVRTNGYAVVVPDVAELVDRHGAGGYLSNGRLRVTVRSSSVPVRLVVAPADAVRRFVDGVARTELSRVGFAQGPQPVDLVEFSGMRDPGLQTVPGVVASGTDVELPVSADVPLAVLLTRVDGQAGLTVSLGVGMRSGWLEITTWSALLLGAIGTIGGGLIVLIGPRRRKAAEDSERIADGYPPSHRHSRRGRDLTGELVTVPSWEYPYEEERRESPYVHTAT
jgi:hypothetical protein